MVGVASPQFGGSAWLLGRRATAAFASAAFLLSAAPVLHAGEIYKSTDANGNVVYSDHADPSSTKTTVVELQDPRYPPHKMHFCWTNCFTLIYDGQLYHRADGTDETWTVTKFSADSFVLHRHSVPAQWNGFSGDVIYEGHTANDRLMRVSVNGTPTSGIDASWGIALNTLPGSNAERDAPHATASRGVNADEAAPDRPSPSSTDDITASAAFAPPPLLDDPQPAATQEGYLWTPGYWGWGNSSYSWIAGAWARPPGIGLLWTPGYWGFFNGRYVFHPGYWDRQVGFYGGINYGFGYFGSGYVGGHWIGNAFAYNSAVNHLTPGAIRNTYVEAVPNRTGRSLVSYSGGPGGIAAIPTAQERSARAEALAATAAPSARTYARNPAGLIPARPTGPAPIGNVKESLPDRQNGPVEVRPPVSENQQARTAVSRNPSPQTPRVSRPTATKSPAQP